jgi:hypothetical protein
MAGLLWNQWQLSCGTGGSFAVESVAGFTWNQWQLWRGIRSVAATAWFLDPGTAEQRLLVMLPYLFDEV